MEKLANCVQHNRPLELFCLTCKKLICPECLSTHDNTCPECDYEHILQYSQRITLPKLDAMISENEMQGPENDIESQELLTSLYNIITPLQRTVEEHTTYMNQLKSVDKEINLILKGAKVKLELEGKQKEYEKYEKRMHQALKDHNIKEVVTLCKLITTEGEKRRGYKEEIKIMNDIKPNLNTEKDIEAIRKVADEVQLILFRCQRLRLNFSVLNWKIDKNFLSPKISLSENCLEISCSQGTNYASIIGDIPIDYGQMSFEVTSSNLCCNGKEGFGLIEYEKYKEIYAANPLCPSAYDDMIGLFQGDIVKGMLILTGNELLLDVPFTVNIDMCNLVMNIKGPGTLLTTELKSGVQYVPCFSIGCTKNKFIIRPLEAIIDETF